MSCLSGCPANQAVQAPKCSPHCQFKTYVAKARYAGGLAPHAAVPDGCVVRRMPARSARAARGRGPRKLPVSGAPYERAAASRRSDAGGLGSPVGRSCFCLPRAARRDRGRRRTTISCLHEKRSVAAGTVDDAERRPHVVGLRCGGFRWGRLPMLGEIIFGPAPPPRGVVGLPDGAEGQAQGGVGGLFRVLEPF